MFTYDDFVQNVKEKIEINGFKQSAVAKKAGFTEKEFSSMLNGRKVIRAEYVPRICFALQTTPNDLFGAAQ